MQKLKTKTIPCLVMLLGGLIAILIARKNAYDTLRLLKVVLVTLMSCYFLGVLIKIAVDKIEIPIPEEDEESDEEIETEEAVEEVEEAEKQDESFQEKAANLIRDMLISDESGEKRERYFGNATDEELYEITQGIPVDTVEDDEEEALRYREQGDFEEIDIEEQDEQESSIYGGTEEFQ